MNHVTASFPFHLTVQTVLSSREEFSKFEEQLALLQQLGFYGIELNLPDLQVISPAELSKLLARYGLSLTYIATGAYAKKRGLSLSSSCRELRTASVNGALENAAYAEAMGAGIILGFFKGGPEADSDDPLSCLRQSVLEICERSSNAVPILVEATNHRETCVIKRVGEGVSIAKELARPNLFVLPDTYHMAMEEQDMTLAVTENLQYVRNIHLSDDNRLFPGFGRIDFKDFLSSLLRCGYSGTLGIEGNIRTSFVEDIAAASEYLSGLQLT